MGRRRTAALGSIKEGGDGIGAGVQRRGPQPGERQVREPARHGGNQALQLLGLLSVQCTQLMAERGREFETVEGLGWVAGEVVAIEPAYPSLKIPHMGWNEVSPRAAHPVLAGLPAGTHAYFVHSFELRPAEPGDLLADTDYGGPIAAVVGRDNLIGTQFHPEKSQMGGLRLIANFLRWRP